MRRLLVSELAGKIMGPKNGSNEEVASNPLSEYITGVLVPESENKERDPDQEADVTSIIPGNGISLEDDNDDNIAILSHTSFLDPKSRPRSVGISFNVSGSGQIPMIDMCATWARYSKVEGKKLWKRNPKSFVTGPVEIYENYKKSWYIDASGNQLTPENTESAEMSIHLISRKLSENAFHISVFLVNPIKSDSTAKTELCIFQPQIRIICLNCQPEPIKKPLPIDTTEKELEFIYRKKTILAKGHSCSAVWKDIDPERPLNGNIYKAAPFYWVDGDTLPDNIKKRFVYPDVRTEFIPIFPIESPSYGWDSSLGNKPELNANNLSELWNEVDIFNSLMPFVNGYEKWIENLEHYATTLNGDDKKTAENIINKCREFVRRLKAGVDILAHDREARLAFCFANKAMYIQHRWKPIETEFEWYPFQLAFILLTVESVTNTQSMDRNICDLLSVPTGAGKSEAYLAIATFVLALRRRRTSDNSILKKGGLAVMMRYTLRLLTVQQFRRALRMITACEYLRVHGFEAGRNIGWRPIKCDMTDDFIWGTERFSIGLWVGGDVTPNRLRSKSLTKGAIEILKGENGKGEPAQITECPSCHTSISVPYAGLLPGKYTLHFVASAAESFEKLKKSLKSFLEHKSEISGIKIENTDATDHKNGYITISIEISSLKNITQSDVDNVWHEIELGLKSKNVEIKIESVNPHRNGYFLLRFPSHRGTDVSYNYEIFCPNPHCDLNNGILWCESKPAGEEATGLINFKNRKLQSPTNMVFVKTLPFSTAGSEFISYKIPISALTIDEQVYTAPPSMLIGTIDKIARLPFEPRSSALFGNVNRYHSLFGYYRKGCPPVSFEDYINSIGNVIEVVPFQPPELIIQDELHLIEGPLGSMTGMYETAVEYLASQSDIHQTVKYIASTATAKEAESQIMSIFHRETFNFPAHGVDADDSFFVKYAKNPHPLEEAKRGRLYVGICAPGLGSLSPIRDIWSSLMYSVHKNTLSGEMNANHFWTLIGYFNAVRELAGALALYKQDIPGRLDKMSCPKRDLPEDRRIELSGRTESSNLPVLLSMMENNFSGNPQDPSALDAVFTTSMFGTGVDVSRLGLMVVHGQPKTNSSYIQSTGRVGRNDGGLVITFYKSSRPRDVSHYEMFCGYHMNLDRFVEPVTVAPFSSGALARCAGPTIVGILRNMKNSTNPWHENESAISMKTQRWCTEVSALPQLFESKARFQPPLRQPEPGLIEQFINSELEKWHQCASRQTTMKYSEYHYALSPVVLGDSLHTHKDIPIIFPNAPQSLRDVEETTGFQT